MTAVIANLATDHIYMTVLPICLVAAVATLVYIVVVRLINDRAEVVRLAPGIRDFLTGGDK